MAHAGHNSVGLPGLDRRTFLRLAKEYRRRWGIELAAVTPQGVQVLGRRTTPAEQAALLRPSRQLALEEALRWGEPTVQMAAGASGMLLWAVPLMHNARLVGGLLAALPEERFFARRGQPFDSRGACLHLRQLAERENLTNAALLEARRREDHQERERAEAIHVVKALPQRDVTEVYLLDEPALIAAIRKGDRREARGTLNRILLVFHSYAGEDLDLIKSFFMELVVTMSRMAVEAGGNPQQLLGANFARLSELARLNSQEQLAPWLHQMLEHIMDAIEFTPGRSPAAIMASALRFMGDHLDENLSRDQTARHVHLSPWHFSRLFKQRLGQSFGAVLTRMRIDRACELLRRTDQALADIALACGFRDQSYFTRVFHRGTGQTPRRYRQAHPRT